MQEEGPEGAQEHRRCVSYFRSSLTMLPSCARWSFRFAFWDDLLSRARRSLRFQACKTWRWTPRSTW
uniref:Uncharacterized protein n=1 Tax=Arundo donax TaxID=35708 RepID=A0A0A9EMK8_ARUDO